MRHATIYTTDEAYASFLMLTQTLDYVTKIETDDEEEGNDFDEDDADEPTKEEVIAIIKSGFEEMKLINEGKLVGTSWEDFLKELEEEESNEL